MKAYADIQNMKERFGVLELLQLTAAKIVFFPSFLRFFYGKLTRRLLY